MNQHIAEAYKRITGSEPPVPFEERTSEEHARDRDMFLTMVQQSSDEEDAAMDELFRNIQTNLDLRVPDFSGAEEESA